MNTIFRRLSCCFIALLLSPLLAVFSLIILLYTPIDYLRFRMSDYRKDTGHKYLWLVTASYTYRIYKIVKRDNLPITYFEKKGTNAACGYFVSGDTLLIYDLDPGSVYYDTDNERWYAFYNGKRQNMEELIDEELSLFEGDYGTRPASATVLYDPSKLEDETVARLAEESGIFLMYGKRELEEALAIFGSKNINFNIQ